MSRAFPPRPYFGHAFQDERNRYAAVVQRAAPPPPPRPKLGDTVRVKMAFTNGEAGYQTGRIVYVHETHLFYTVELPNGIRESFKWGDTG